MPEFSRQAYADMFGPHYGDRVAMQGLRISGFQVEKDYTVYG